MIQKNIFLIINKININSNTEYGHCIRRHDCSIAYSFEQEKILIWFDDSKNNISIDNEDMFFQYDLIYNFSPYIGFLKSKITDVRYCFTSMEEVYKLYEYIKGLK